MTLFFQDIAFILALALFCPRLVLSQNIEITIRGQKVDKAIISALAGEEITPIDSLRPDDAGMFHFALKAGQTHPGLYRLTFDKNTWINFVNDGEDVKINTNVNNIADSTEVLASESNLFFYTFVKMNKQYKAKSDLLQLILARYPQDDPFYASAQAATERLKKDYAYVVASAPHANWGSFIRRYVRSARLPVVDFSLPVDQQLVFLKSHALDSVDFNDDGLINSDLFTSKSIEYLMYYRNPQLPKELLEKEFMSAVDTILNRARVNQIVYQHVTQYLIEGFKRFGFEKCIDYILDNYVVKDDLCLNQESGGSIQRMIEQKKLFPIGATVPDIALADSSGRPTSLKSLKGDTTLVLFYSALCPHCQTTIPKLAAQYSKSLMIYAVSLDTSKSDWLTFIRSKKLSWIDVNDPLGWNGKAVSDYSVYATPSMFLIDKERKVIGKPVTLEELEKLLP